MKEEEAFEKVDITKIPFISPQFAEGKLEPRYMFLVRTDKDNDAFVADALKDLQKALPKVDIKEIEAIVRSHPHIKDACTHEYHACLVAEDMTTKEAVTFVTDYHAHTSSNKIKTREVSREDSIESQTFNARINSLRLISDNPQPWNKHSAPLNIEGATWGEFMAQLTGDSLAVFNEMYPDSVMGTALKADYNRDALVKRYGEKKVADLEQRAGIKSLKVKHE